MLDHSLPKRSSPAEGARVAFREPHRSLLLAIVLRYLKERGIPTSGLVSRFGALVAEAGEAVEVSIERANAFLETAARLAEDEHLGISLASSVSAGSLGPLEYGWRNAATLGASLSFVSKNYRIYGNGFEVQWRTLPDRAVYSRRCQTATPVSRHSNEFFVAYTLAQMRSLTGSLLDVSEVAFGNPPPPDVRVLAEHLGVTKVSFDSGDTRVTFDSKDVDAVVVGADPLLFALIEDYVRMLLDDAPREVSDAHRTAVRLSAVIRARIGREPVDLRTLAEACRLSPRTLQRRLEAAGTSLRALVLEARREEAFSSHTESAGFASGTELSLGYSNEESLLRAFLRWKRGQPIDAAKGG